MQSTFHAHDTGLRIERVSDDAAVSDDWYSIKGRECEITLESRPTYCDRGNWIAKLHPTGSLALEIDDADGWPRYYFNLDRALAEIEAWLVKRGQLVAD